MHIYKMHGTGNDFVLLENLKETPMDYSTIAKAWCDRHFGIGADGLILILPSKLADFKMRIFNSDGSEAEMCGNGVRCFARHVFERKLIDRPKFRLETLAGVVEPECLLSHGHVESVRVHMGIPRYGDLHARSGKRLKLSDKDIVALVKLGTEVVRGATISMGNPHYVIFEESGFHWNMQQHGQELSIHPIHPHQSNVEFVKILAPDHIQVDVWERGVGPTLACGSGACAAMAAGRILKGLRGRVTVDMPGGPLDVEWDGEGAIFLTGAATYVFEGDISEELTKKISAHQVA